MNKTALLFLCFFILIWMPVFGGDSDYLENVRLDPGHGELNIDGEVDVLFNLPQHTLVRNATLTFKSGTTDITVKTVKGSSLSYLNNKMTITGTELYQLLRGTVPPQETPFRYLHEMRFEDSDDDHETPDENEEFPDEDEEIPDKDEEVPDEDEKPGNGEDDPVDEISKYDAIYSFVLTVELDTSGDSTEDEDEGGLGDIFDDEEEEEETTTGVPASVSSSFFIVFDNVPPEAPVSVETEGGDRRIVLRITPPYVMGSNEIHDKIGKYHITLSGLFERDGTEVESTVEYVSTVREDEYDEIWEVSLSAKDGLDIINNDDGLEKYIYTVKISAEDVAGNHNPDKLITTEASAVTTFGFWSHYKAEGGGESGGFCFIASESFGSYDHSYVQILRNFRDIYLNNFDPGRALVKLYYSLGHYGADIIESYSFIKPAVKALLFPLVIAAWLLTETVGQIILGLWLLIAVTLLSGKILKFAVPFLLLLIILGTPSDLKAIGGEFSFTNSFYYPSIDKELESNPFEIIGGAKKRYLPSATFGFQIPLLDEYIRWSAVGGIGFTRFKGTSIKADGEQSPDSTAMYFIPLTGEIKIRPAYSFPVWPYGSFGMDYVIWWIREKNSTAKHGGTFGLHGSLGLMLSLNWIEPGAAQKLQHSTGITNTALFAHFRLEKIDNFGKEGSFDLSNHRFEFGILFEF